MKHVHVVGWRAKDVNRPIFFLYQPLRSIGQCCVPAMRRFVAHYMPMFVCTAEHGIVVVAARCFSVRRHLRNTDDLHSKT